MKNNDRRIEVKTERRCALCSVNEGNRSGSNKRPEAYSENRAAVRPGKYEEQEGEDKNGRGK